MRHVRNASFVIAAILLVPIVVAGQAPPQAKATQEDEFLKGVIVLGHLPEVAPPPGVTAPVLKARVFPRYTVDAMRAKIQGQVQVQVVVRADGSVARARVTKSLDKVYGLDDAAIAAAMQSAFEPGLLNGEKVAMAVLIDLEFRLH
jgi:TonB family protein